jgi:4-amino-4-deoxy-L-arabinose transferase-like glycosyltransferase
VNKSLTERQASWLSLALIWTLLLVLAATRPLAVPDEGRYGEIGRWMLQSGDWLTPRLNGIPFFHKPPYLYWLQAMSLASFGINELALRLVPALHAGLMMLALYLSARAISTEQVARRAAIMLGTSLAFLIGGQYINHDMLVATWIGVAIWCFGFSFKAGDKPHAGLARLGFVACALGFLSKGLIGFALPGLVLFIWLIWTRQFKKVLYLPWLTGLVLFAVVALPWFVLSYQQFPDMLGYIFGTHQFQRYTGKTFNNPQPWWFYLLALLLLLFPWVLFALQQLRKPRTLSEVIPADWWRLCWAWVGGILVFFSIPNSKLVGYVLPVVPAVALLASLGWQHTLAHRRFASKAFASLCVLAIGIAVAINYTVDDVTEVSRSKDVAAVLACEAKPADTVYVVGGYPYDLPFYLQLPTPMIVIQDWEQERKSAGDGWQRELFEAANFDAQAAKVLQSPEALTQAGAKPGNWLVGFRESGQPFEAAGWKLFFKGAGWNLYQSAGGLAAEGPEAAQQKGLPGCKHQRHK